MRQKRGANTYAKIGIESSVLAASPIQLIVMLFDGAQSAIRSAKLHIQSNQPEIAGQKISKAMDIINEGLIGSLDYKSSPDVSASFEQLYATTSKLLYDANRYQDTVRLDQADKILEELNSAWRSISETYGVAQ